MRHFPTLTLAFLLATVSLTHVYSQETRLRSEFKTEILDADPIMPVPPDLALTVSRLKTEAAFSFSGMIWGFRFSYVPLDNTRKIAESFTMTPQSSFPKDSARLTPNETRMEGNWFFAYVEYRLSPEESGMLSSWQNSLYPKSQGTGQAPARDWDSRFDAVKDAARMAVREYARGVTLNKPREVTGWCSFEKPPAISYRLAQYFAKVKIRIKIEEIRQYGVY